MNQRNRFPARRRFLKQSAALSASASLAAPAAVLAQVRTAPVIGLLHPLTGGFAAAGPALCEAAALALRDAANPAALHAERVGYASAAKLGTALQRLQRRVRACIVTGVALPLPQLDGAVLSLAPALLNATTHSRAPAAGKAGIPWHALPVGAPPAARPAIMGSYAAAHMLAEVLPQAASSAQAVALLEAVGAQPWRGSERAPPLDTLIVVAADGFAPRNT